MEQKKKKEEHPQDNFENYRSGLEIANQVAIDEPVTAKKP